MILDHSTRCLVYSALGNLARHSFTYMITAVAEKRLYCIVVGQILGLILLFLLGVQSLDVKLIFIDICIEPFIYMGFSELCVLLFIREIIWSFYLISFYWVCLKAYGLSSGIKILIKLYSTTGFVVCLLNWGKLSEINVCIDFNCKQNTGKAVCLWLTLDYLSLQICKNHKGMDANNFVHIQSW